MTWTDQGLALRKALEEAIERAQPTGRIRTGAESVSVAALRTILRAHPVDEGDLPEIKLIDRYGTEIPVTEITVHIPGRL